MGVFWDFKPQYLNVIRITIFVLQSDCFKNMRGGDNITSKQWFLPIVVVSVAIVGLFSGILNDQGPSYSTGSKIIESPSQASTVPAASEEKVEAKTKSNAIKVTAKCSCSLYGDYKLHGPSWVNYCPRCHSRAIVFEKTGDCPEGMMRCTRCDADFCAVHGKEHINSRPAYLAAA
ncbi:hypothetical protein [Methanobacterium sp.]|uniref:hypothetical protein n=1 Tax=Methanobacterium sp. TaxID=2164 RepID=UPI003C71F6C7